MNYKLDELGFLQDPWLHDGYLTGISTADDVVTLTLKTLGGQQFGIRLLGTVEMRATDFKLGNIILGIRLTTCTHIDRDRFSLLDSGPHKSAAQEFHDIYFNQLDEKRSAILLGELALFELSSSYGCVVDVLCKEMVVFS
ncbi:hypothetical protein [Shinella sp.]|uniref:hypothetical protein n=1 Tax=Shinella sp. TaxID=1870904 RepID=UPI0040370430